MSYDLIKVGANGQLEFDFESLEAWTSKNFVEFVQEQLLDNKILKSSLTVIASNFIRLYLTVSVLGDQTDWLFVCSYTPGGSMSVDKITIYDFQRLSILM